MAAGATGKEVRLAEGFPSASFADWKVLVGKAIKGADFERKLVSRTADGLRIDPLYTRADALAPLPFVRGTGATRPPLGWDICQLHIDNDPEAANAAILEDLDGGATSIALEIKGAAGMGLAPDTQSIGRALDGVMLDCCSITLIAGEATAEAAQSLRDVWDKAGTPLDRRRGSFGANPIGDLARMGRLARPLDVELAAAAELAKASLSMPGVKALRADGVLFHMGGASEAQELAAMLATVVAYLRALETARIEPKQGLPKIEIVLALDDDQFMSLAKLRAARRLIGRIAEACGAPEAMRGVTLTAVTSMRMMARRDPWTNILRTTIACAAGALGGADAICVLPFTFALGKPDSFARRVARNIQIVCQEESNLGRVADPAGGSWYVEHLSSDLASKAWSLFQSLEEKGGIAAALASGWLQDEIGAIADARAKAIASGKIELTGVSAFPLLGDDAITAEPWVRPQSQASAPQPAVTVRPLKMARLAEPFEALRDAADAHAAKTGKPFNVFLASIGEVIDHNVRSTWIKNYLAAGGIAVAMSDGYPSAEAAAAAFKTSGASAACICTSDALNARHAEATARALKAAGARLVMMAGRPGDNEAGLKAAGVDQFLFAGQDAVETLRRLQEKLK